MANSFSQHWLQLLACICGITCKKIMQSACSKTQKQNVFHNILLWTFIINSHTLLNSCWKIFLKYIRLLKAECSRPPFSKVKLSFYIIQAEVEGQGKLQNVGLTPDPYRSLKSFILKRQHEFYILRVEASKKKKHLTFHHFSSFFWWLQVFLVCLILIIILCLGRIVW